MRKKILILLIVIVCFLGAYAAYLFKINKDAQSGQMPNTTADNSVKNTDLTSEEEGIFAGEAIPEIEEKEEEKFTGILDMDKWKYNEQDEVYYQTGIYYSQASLESLYQRMALFVPEKYLRCNKIEDDLFSCVPNMAALINNYTVRSAPIVSEINSPNFASELALTEYRDYKEYTDNGLVYAHIGFRGVEHNAPAAVVDIKAAIHFIKYNSERIPGNTDSVFLIGVNEGAALASVVAAGGDSRLYTPYLQEIGALSGLNDSIKGVMLINPVSGLDTRNEAVEWFFNYNRQGLTDEQMQLSEKMVKEYANYINRAGFIGPEGNALTLQYSKNGTYQSGTYYDYMKSTVRNSLQYFISSTLFPYNVPKSWEISEDEANAQGNIKLAGTYQTRDKFINDLNAQKIWVTLTDMKGIDVISLNQFNNIFNKKQIPFAITDDLKKERTGNILFGLGDKQPLHFDQYSAKALKGSSKDNNFEADLYIRDKYGNTTLKRLDMYNPLYFILPSYEGYRTSTVAPYWFIRGGLFQNNDILPSTVNLYLAVNSHLNGNNSRNNNVKRNTVNYQMIWGMGDVTEIRKNDRTDFIEWIKKII